MPTLHKFKVANTRPAEIVAGRSYRAVVEAMLHSKLNPDLPLERFMAALADRVRGCYGVTLNTATPAKFIRSLVTAGLLKPVK